MPEQNKSETKWELKKNPQQEWGYVRCAVYDAVKFKSANQDVSFP